MKTELYIAKKIIQGQKNNSRLSRPIVIISLASIIIGVAVMIISVSIVTGFQESIRDKVIGFGSHIEISKMEYNNSMESSPLLINQDFYPSIEEDEGVKKIQIFAYKPAILQSYRDSVHFNVMGKDSIKSTQDVLGVLFKGIGNDYDLEFFEDKLLEGSLIDLNEENDEVMISQYVSNIMGYDVGEKIEAHFIVDGRPKKRVFTVKGIYRTGFEEFDKQYIFTQIQHIQKLNKWGIQTLLTVRDTCIDNKFVLSASSVGGVKSYKYDWDQGFEERNYLLIDGNKDTNIRVISSDFQMELMGLSDNYLSIPDTAYARIKISKPCDCNQELLEKLPIDFISESNIKMPFGIIEIDNGKGTRHLYTGGFEILINEWSDLENMSENIYSEKIDNSLKTTTIVEKYEGIFTWLDFMDINILIVIVLILIVSLINMITSLLVMILEKTNMIGVFKALGASNSSIRKIFLYNSLFLLSRGLFWGNLLGIGFLLLQYFTRLISLNPDVYYLDYVPVNLNLMNILLINLLTIIICRITLIIPSLLVTRIDPIKAIKFD